MPEWGSIDGWGGICARKSLIQKFQQGSDDRALFYATSDDPTITDPHAFTSGWGVTKWNNLDSKTGGPVASNDVEVKVPETDIPFLRVAEAYLTYAEAAFRDAAGNKALALERFNALRTRANAQLASNLTLELLRDEWSREFYFEGRRRIDLVRFDSFGGNTDYNWDWKAGVANGTSFDKKYNILPIPVSDRNANPNLVQNPGY
ncbi:MAG: RagB/SusD family nutrient uptake outer membrane protein [Muribaculaceae bacterium]|nr:RagB/SusD family nutrient uptake outer membrane protein [Muribaculaceae bacterium]